MRELGDYGLQSEVETFGSIVETLLVALEMRHPGAGLRAHSERVAQYAVQLGRQLGVGVIERDKLYFGGLLHDIGKLGVPDDLLGYTADISPDHRREYQKHVNYGLLLCSTLAQAAPLLAMIRGHHEKLDGSGYPDGLDARQLCLSSQILAVANAYDNLCAANQNRPGHGHARTMQLLHIQVARGWWNAEAVALLSNNASAVEGSQFGTRTKL